MNNIKDIADKILNCKTYDIPDIQTLARAYLELDKQYLLCAMDRNHYEEEITKLKEDLRMCREIGVEMQREVNRKLSVKYEKSIAALTWIKNRDFRGNRSEESVAAFSVLKELGEL